MLAAQVLVPALADREGSAFWAVLVGAAAGASGGLAYTAIRPLLRRLGRAGDYLTGVGTMLAYMWTIAVMLPEAFGDGRNQTGRFIAFSLTATFFGLVIGHHWFATPSEERNR